MQPARVYHGLECESLGRNAEMESLSNSKTENFLKRQIAERVKVKKNNNKQKMRKEFLLRSRPSLLLAIARLRAVVDA